MKIYSLNNVKYNKLISVLNEFLSFEIDENSDFVKNFNNWYNNVKEFTSQSILPKNNELLNPLDKYFISYSYQYKSEYEQKLPTSFYEIESVLESLKFILKKIIKYLQVSDYLKTNSIPDIQNTEEKIDFILEKLNFLFDDYYYSIPLILELNCIKYRNDECEEIAENLFKREYGLKSGNYWEKSDSLKITIKGSRYIERKIKSRNKKDKDENLDKKIDEVLLRLQKLGFGQEIIFNEIEELRELQTKLSKKSWGQLLKGKLVDLAIEKIVDVNTATFIYEYLTNSNFKLLK